MGPVTHDDQVIASVILVHLILVSIVAFFQAEYVSALVASVGLGCWALWLVMPRRKTKRKNGHENPR